MNIRNVEIDFDFLDADDLEKFEYEAKKLQQIIDREAKKQYTGIEIIKVQCRMIENFFNKVFGEGISDKLFQKKNNLNDHLLLFEEVIKAKQNNDRELENRFKKYQPRKGK